jgi:hypothetical protein
VAGLVLKLKPSFDKIAIWMTNGTPIDEINSLKADIIRITNVKESDIEFMDFQE